MSAITVAVNLVGNNYTAGAFGALSNEMAILGSRSNMLAKYLAGLGTATKIAAGAALAGAAAFALFKAPLQAGFSGAQELELELLKLRQALQVNTDAAPVLTQAINDLGIKTVYSSTDAAEAFTLLVKSGFNASQVMYGAGAAAEEYRQHAYNATEATHGLGFEALALGQALGISANDGANLAATALHQWNTQIMQSKDPTKAASDVINNLAGAYLNVTTSGADMLRFLEQAGPTAASMGIEFKDLMTTADIMGQHFGQLDIAGTRLRYFLQTLVKPTAAQSKEMASLGLWTINTTKSYRDFEAQLIKNNVVSKDQIKLWDGSITGLKKMFEAAQSVGMIGLDVTFGDWAAKSGFLNEKIYDSHGKVKSLKDIIDQLRGSLKNLTPEERNAALSNLFNVRGGDIGRMVAVINDFDTAYAKVNKRIGDTSVVKMAAERLHTLKGAWEAFTDTVKSSLSVAFLNLLPPITQLITHLNDLIGTFLRLPPKVQTALGVFLIVGAALSGLVMVVGGAIAVIGLLGPAFAALGLTGGPLIAVLGGVAAGLIAIPAVAAGVWLAFQQGGSVTDRLRSAWDALKEHLGPLLGVLSGIAGAFLIFGGRMDLVWGVVAKGYGALGGLLRVLGGILPFLRGLAEGAMLVLQNLGPLAGMILPKLASLFGALAGPIRTVWTFLMGLDGVWMTFFANIGGWSGILSAIGGLFASLGSSISGALSALAAFLAPAAAVVGIALLIAAAVAGVVMTFQHWWETSTQFRAILTDLWKRIQDLGTLLMGQFREAWKGIQDAMKQLQPTLAQVGQLWETLKPALMVIGGIIIVVLVAAIGVLIAALRGIISAIGPLVSGLAQAFAGVAQVVMGVVQVIVGIFQFFVGLVKGLFTGDWTTLQAGLRMLWTGIQNILGGLVNTVVGLFRGLIGGVIGLIGGFVGGIIDWFKHLWETLVGHSIVPDLINSIIHWFLSLPGKIISAIIGFVLNIVGQFAQLSVKVLATINYLVNLALSLFKSWGDRGLATIVNMVNNICNAALTMEKKVLDTISKMVSTLLSWLGKMGSDAWHTFTTMAGNVANTVGGMKDSVLARVGQMKDNILGKAGQIKDALLKPFNDAKNAIGGIIKGFYYGMKGGFDRSADGINGLLKGFTSAISGIAGKIGLKLNLSFPNVPHLPGFARGVRGFRGGLAMVGEEGPEFALLGGRKPALLGQHGPEVRNLPRDTSILPYRQTLDLLNGKLAIPGFAGGIGDVLGGIGGAIGNIGSIIGKKLGDAMDWFNKSGSWLVQTALKAIGFNPAGVGGGVMADLTKGAVSKLVDAAAKIITSAKDKFFASSAGGMGFGGTAAGLLPGFPTVNQLALRDVNAYADCVPASLTSGAAYLLHRMLDASLIKAAVYGAGYRGGQSSDRYMGYFKSHLGVNIGKQYGSQSQLIGDIERGIASGHPVAATIPSNWNANSGSGLHQVMFAGYDRGKGLLTAMNPWRGFFQTASAGWWAPRLRLGSVYPLGRAYGDGGLIDEPVMGYGLRSGKPYSIGERGSELVIPLSQLLAQGGLGGNGAESSSGHGRQTITNNIYLDSKLVGQSVLELTGHDLRRIGANRMGRS